MMNLRRFTANKICRRWWISADTQQITICRMWWISAGTQKITGFSRDESPWSIGDWWLWDSMSAGFHGFSCTEFFLFCSPLSFWWSPYSPPPFSRLLTTMCHIVSESCSCSYIHKTHNILHIHDTHACKHMTQIWTYCTWNTWIRHICRGHMHNHMATNAWHSCIRNTWLQYIGHMHIAQCTWQTFTWHTDIRHPWL